MRRNPGDRTRARCSRPHGREGRPSPLPWTCVVGPRNGPQRPCPGRRDGRRPRPGGRRPSLGGRGRVRTGADRASGPGRSPAMVLRQHDGHACGRGDQDCGSGERLGGDCRAGCLAGWLPRPAAPAPPPAPCPVPDPITRASDRGGCGHRQSGCKRLQLGAAGGNRRRERRARPDSRAGARAPAARAAPGRHRPKCFGGSLHRPSRDPPRTRTKPGGRRRWLASPRRPTCRARSRSPRARGRSARASTARPAARSGNSRRSATSCPNRSRSLGLVLRRGHRRLGSFRELLPVAAEPEERDRLVVSDPEQPRTHRRAALSSPQRHQRPGERGLKGVLGIRLVAHDRPAIPVQRLVIALVQRRERPLVAAPRSDGPAARRRTEPARRAARSWAAGQPWARSLPSLIYIGNGLPRSKVSG